MGIVMGGIGGLGEAAQNVGSTLFKSELDKEARLEIGQQDSNLALARAKALEDYKNAPLQRLSAKAKQLASEDIPQEPAKAKTLPAYDGGTEGPASFHGDIAQVRKSIAALPDGPDKEAALAQLEQQTSQEQERQTAIVSGKTRKRTPDEAMQAAAEDAKVNDLPAYAMYEKEIGKPQRDERRVAAQEKREDTRAEQAAAAEQRRADADARRYAIDVKKLDLQQGNLEAQNKKIDALIEHWERADENKASGKVGSQERYSTIVNAMNNTIRDLDNNKPSASKADALKEWENQRANAVAVRSRAMAKLNDNLDDAGAAPAPAPSPTPAPKGGVIQSLPPGARKIGTSGGKDVYETPDGRRFIAQ